MRIKIYNKDNTLLTEVTVLEDSVISNEIRGEHTLSLSFSIAEYVDIPEGAYVILNGTTYTLLSQSRVTMNNTRSNEVTAVFEAAQAILSSIRMRNPDDGTLSFPYTATAGDHLSLIIANLNRYSNSNEWTVGECVDDGTVKFLQYDYVSCLDALNSIADIFGTEWEISGTTVSLHKVEYNINSPLELEYGKMKGLRPGIVRETAARPLTRIYTHGGSRNIDASQYGSTILLLPKSVTFKYDGNKFEDEAGFDNDKARTYTTDSGGTYISSLKNASRLVNEGVIDCTDIYPSATHSVIGFDYGETVPSWVTLNVPENLDYSQYVILGELPTVTFQSGNLQGKTFEIRRNQDGSLAISKEYTELGAFVGWKFMMASVIENGMRLPDLQSGMVPENGDTCKIFGVSLPAEHICDNENKTGASWDMLRRGITYLYEYEDSIFSLKVEIDPIWARTNWEYAVQKFRIGGYVKYINSSWAQSGVMLRIQSIRQGVSNPYSIEIELGNGIVGGGILKGLEDKISRQAGSLYEQESSQKTLEYNVSNIGGNFVTLDTDQTVTGKKTFANDVIFGGAVSEGVYGKLLIPSTAGPGIFGLLVSDEPVQGEVPSGSVGLDKAELWLELGGSTDNPVIGKDHLPVDTVYSDDLAGYALKSELPDLTPYATQEWVTGQGYATQTWVQGLGYLTATDADKRYVNITGDTMTGPLRGTDIELSGHISAATLYVPYSGGNKIYSLSVSDTPVQGEAPSGGGGLDSAALWEELDGNATDKVIGLSRIPDIPVDMVSGLLGGDSRILPSLLPDWLMGQLLYGGTVDGTSVATVSAAFKDRYGTGGDTVTLNASNASQYEGVYFIASADASSGVVQSLGVRTGDWVVSNGLAWTKIDNTDSVSSVAGLTGVIGKAALQTALSDSTHRFVTDAQITSWNGKWAWDEEDIKAVKVDAAVLADKAKALNAARSLWGQSFNGTGDVDGDMSGVGGITMSGSIAGAVNADFSGYLSAGTLYIPYSGGNKIYSLKVSDAPVSGESPSGGGGMDANALWLELGGSSSDKVISKSHLPEDTVYEGDLAGYALKSEIPSLTGYATQSWVQSQDYLTSVPKATSSAYGGIKVGYPESGKSYPVELDSSGRAYVSVPWVNTTYSLSSFGITATAAEINKLNGVGTLLHSGNIGSYALTKSNYTSTLDSRYVNVSGDTMTGTLNINSSSEALVRYQISGSNKAASGYLASQGAYLYSYPAGKYLHITDAGSLLFGNSTVWHAGNDGSDSGLDADLLDGYQANDLMILGRSVNMLSGSTYSGYIPPLVLAMMRGAEQVENPTFLNGSNLSVYNNASDGSVTHTRVTDTTAGNGSGYVLKIHSSASATPGGGGFTFQTSKAYRQTTCVFRAKVPVGYTIEFATNDVGSGGLKGQWLTERTGTGKWEWYACTVYFGSSPSTTHFYYLTPAANVDWYLAYAQVFYNSEALYVGMQAQKADRLTTSRTLWGKPFNGTGNVSGDMTGVGSITGATFDISGSVALMLLYNNTSKNDKRLTLYPQSNYAAIYNITVDGNSYSDLVLGNNSNALYYDASAARWGIGTTSPAYKLDVAGTLRATGRITAAGLTSSASIVANAGLTTTTLSASGLITASAGVQVGSTSDIGWYINGLRICAGMSDARGVNVGNLLVSNAWADYTKVPTNGIYSKGNILSAGNIIAYSSSSRLVKDILPKRTTFSQRLTALGSVVDYRYNNVLKRDKDAHIGLVYENVRDAMPGMCHMHEGYGALNYLDTDYINLIAGSVQEHTDEITRLKNRVAALESEVARLKSGRTAA